MQTYFTAFIKYKKIELNFFMKKNILIQARIAQLVAYRLGTGEEFFSENKLLSFLNLNIKKIKELRLGPTFKKKKKKHLMKL